jgi:hypothetical protein
MSRPAEAPNEVALLHHDVMLIHQACQQCAREHVIDADSWDTGRYYAIAGDLWQKHVNHCQGVAILLSKGLFDSALVVNRAAYETAITLTYLMTVGDKLRNAALFEAHMVVDTATVYAEQPGTTAPGAQKALAEIPQDILQEVHANRKKRLPWSGKNLADMAEAIKVSGHKAIYAIMSWPAHARFAGTGIEKIKHPSGDTEFRFGGGPRPQDFESLANHTRRMLHPMYREVTRNFYGVTPSLATTNPFESNRRAMEAREDAPKGV